MLLLQRGLQCPGLKAKAATRKDGNPEPARCNGFMPTSPPMTSRLSSPRLWPPPRTAEVERAFHERVVVDVKDGIEKLAGIGDASLKVLRDKRLYRTTHKTFEEYCWDRFKFKRDKADRQIGFATLLEDLTPRGVKNPPATEYQARPLAALKSPELQAQALLDHARP